MFVADFVYQCENSFEAGGWLRVRFQPSTSNWHPATDGLRGYDVYGDPNAWNAYSIYFKHLIVNDETEFLFSLGGMFMLWHSHLLLNTDLPNSFVW